MTLLHAIILGIVEGVTEFLPISSTAHLIITSTLLRLPQSEFVSLFEVIIQLGAILAIVVLYWRLVWENKEYLWKALVGFAPTAIIGFLLHDVVKNVFFQSIPLIAVSLASVGFVFVVLERSHLSLKKTLSELTYRDAFICGLAQSLALVPGVSRVGAVLIVMLLMRYKRADAAVFSFLIAVPTILGASVLDLVKTDTTLLTLDAFITLFVGMFVAFISALAGIKWLVGFLQKHDLRGFAYYRIALGLGLLLLHL